MNDQSGRLLLPRQSDNPLGRGNHSLSVSRLGHDPEADSKGYSDFRDDNHERHETLQKNQRVVTLHHLTLRDVRRICCGGPRAERGWFGVAEEDDLAQRAGRRAPGDIPMSRQTAPGDIDDLT